MNTLHLVFNRLGLKSCERLKSEGDQIILIGDGVYQPQSDLTDFESHKVFRLEEDYLARGLKDDKTHRLISYDQMVELCTECAPIVSWHE